MFYLGNVFYTCFLGTRELWMLRVVLTYVLFLFGYGFMGISFIRRFVFRLVNGCRREVSLVIVNRGFCVLDVFFVFSWFLF